MPRLQSFDKSSRPHLTSNATGVRYQIVRCFPRSRFPKELLRLEAERLAAIRLTAGASDVRSRALAPSDAVPGGHQIIMRCMKS